MSAPYGYCQCGCGKKTKIAALTDRRVGHVRGQPIKFINGHNHRRHPHGWLVEDRGYLTPCHIWQGCTDKKGYGYGTSGGNRYRAHRKAWIEANGPIPAATPHVLHHCDQPPCVNVEHLFLGTNDDNVADMLAKGRSPRGERSGAAKLTEADVLAIRASNSARTALSARYGVAPWTIACVQMRRTWTHV